MLRNILMGLGVFAALFAVLVFSGKIPVGNNKANTPSGEVVLWGTLPESSMNNIVQAFNPQAKTYRVTYKEVREDVFSQKLLEALANGTGPDMILAPHQIILSQVSRIYPFPTTSLSEKSFKDTYVDGASLFYTPYGALALPVSIEPMVLFYNRTLFSKHGIINPPATWDEITNIVPSFTILDNKNQFIESGIALGTQYVPYAKDILMSIVGQLGQVPVLQQDTPNGMLSTVLANTALDTNKDVLPLSTALRFFTQFSDYTKNTYSWNQYTPKADDQFVAEKLAMYIGYSGELNTLRARNPRGDFEMNYLPQTKGYNTFSTGARMYGIATLKTSKNPTAALNVEAQFSGIGVSPSISAITGGVPALRTYSTTQGLNDVIARSMLVAKPWYDSFPSESTSLTSSMISDVVNNRYSVTDAAAMFVSRLQDRYTPY
jgi:ABC-type glycerol-3-phosphate transport system substrate-binding protein